MRKKFKLGVIGCGFMASAIIRGAVLSDFLSPKKIIASDILESALDKIGETGVYTCNSNKYVAENSEFVLLAVKPQNFEGVAKSFGDAKPEKIISVMAGITKKRIKSLLGDVPVARCMPNLPCSIGSGAIGADLCDFSDGDDSEFIIKVLDNLGTVLMVGEEKMDAVGAINAGGPVYAFMLIDSLIDAGVKQGLSRDEAKVLAVQTVLGSAEMVRREEEPLSDLIMGVCGKGGATLEAVKILEENNFRGAVAKAVESSVKRAKELTDR